ncbi:actin cortical patch SUR7/pH-response regulator pali [Boletus edulis]|uniref:Actin cortical patch SUR7/pH-response regulator pali n=1 Tax=Boletus edulis BED1 TaxID=1328754 RepID=A0AAD4C2U2_BOLED|nr:actin cortical patch SUR7/pH-response regulator pali [Boletus edulis]KAF8446209.1 actin cortical patch SUR7/pH-response regulator pali [Boletus edulis BED1]
MRGEYCIVGASFLSFAALLLLIFVHVGQINTSTVPHGISMAIVNVSGYGEALSEATNDTIQGLYTANASSPFGQGTGIRQQYAFGLYSYCAYVNSSAGQCSSHTIAATFQPYTAITSDMLLNYSQLTTYIFVDTTFINSSYLGTNSHVAYYFLLLGTLFTALSLFTGILRSTVFFLFSTTMSILSALFILIAAAIWTAIVKKVESVNTMQLAQGIVSGIKVSYGSGIYLSWAAFACLLAAIIPSMISCCTFRG